MQTSTSGRASGSSIPDELPPANPYGPPPGIFNDILNRLGLKKKKKEETVEATATATTTPTTDTGGGGGGGAPTTDTGGGGGGGASAESGGGGAPAPTTPAPAPTTPAPTTTPAPSGPVEGPPTFEEALAKAIAEKKYQEIMDLATDQTSREKVFDAMMGANLAAGFLSWLNSAGNAGTWVPVLNDARYEQFIGAVGQSLVADQNSYNTVWTLYNDPAARTLNAATVTWSKLYTSQILPSGNTSVTWPGGTSASSDGATTYEWRSLYQPVGPSEATMKRLMVGVRPLPRGHVNIANIAFVNQSVSQYRTTAPTVSAWSNEMASGAPVTTTLGTSYYLDLCKTVVIVCDSGGGATNDFSMGSSVDAGGVGGVTGGPALTWFMNHVRHEVGHAVGASSLAGVSETGNNFATSYGGWAASSAAAIKAAPYWTASGSKKLTIGGVESDISATAAADWLAGLVEGGAEPAGNAVTLLAGAVSAKINAIEVAWSGQPLTAYIKAITGNGGNLAVKDSAYQFPGFTPPGADVIFWSSRFTPNGWTKYSKTAFDACVPKMGWYSVSSPVEMFAEMYTHKYSGGALPASANGKSPTSFFTEIENSTDTQFKATGGAEGGSAPMNPAVRVPSNTLPRD